MIYCANESNGFNGAGKLFRKFIAMCFYTLKFFSRLFDISKEKRFWFIPFVK